MQELIYTSYTKGVKPGVSGFCTVVVSEDMAPNRISRLEGLSGYRHLYQPGTPDAALNPPAWSHVLMNIGDSEFYVVYRVGDAGLDYTGRSNKLGHFIVLEKNELPPCGPATMLLTPGLIETQFDGNVGTRPFTRPIPSQLVSPRPCNLWKQIAGDAGWAGLLAQTAYTGQHACILFKPGTDMLPLIQEAMALLPPEMRWKTTFSTYFSKLPTGLDCQWRCAVSGTPEAELAMAEREKILVMDLSHGQLGQAPNSPAVMAARTGRAVVAPKNDVQNNTYTNTNTVRQKQTNSKISNDEILLDLEQTETQNNDLLDSFDSSSPILSNTSKGKSKQRKQANKEIPLSYWIVGGVSALILLIGIMIGVIFCLSKPSETIAITDDTVKTENDTDSNEASNSDVETVIPTTDDEKSQEEQRKQEEAQRKEQEERDAQLKAEEDKRLAEQKQKEAEEAQRQAEEEKARQEEEARKAKAELEARKAAQEKAEQERKDAFDNPRWVGVPKKDWFIFVNPDKSLDYTRLNYLIKDRIEQITNIEAIQILDVPSDREFSIKKQESGNGYACYIGNDLCDLAIEINTELKSDGFQQNGYLAFTEGCPEMDDFIKQCVLKVTFSDGKSQIISFLKSEESQNLLRTLNNASKINKTKPTFNIDDNGFNKQNYSMIPQVRCRTGAIGNLDTYRIIEAKENDFSFDIEINMSETVNHKANPNLELTDEDRVFYIQKFNISAYTPKSGNYCQFQCKFDMEYEVEIPNPKYQNKDSKQNQTDDLNSNPADNNTKGTKEPPKIKEKRAIIIPDEDKDDSFTSKIFSDEGLKKKIRAIVTQLPMVIDVYLSDKNNPQNTFIWKRITIAPFKPVSNQKHNFQ